MTPASVRTAIADAFVRLRAHRDAPVVLCAAVAYGLSVYLALSLTRNSTSVAAIWPANAFLLAGLLGCRTSNARAVLVGVCTAACAAATFANSDPWGAVIAFPIIGISESLLAYRILRNTFGKHVALTNGIKVAQFAVVCFIAALIPSAVGAVVVAKVFGGDPAFAFVTWYLADSLGLLVITPTLLLIRQTASSFESNLTVDDLVRHFVILSGASLVVFMQSAVPLLFLLIPVSVLIAFRLGPRYAAMATLWLTAVSLICTHQGWGPAALMGDSDTRLWVVQLFCFVNLLTSLGVAAELSERDRLRRELERVSVLASDRRRQLDTALDAMSQGVCLFDSNNRVVVRNNRFLSIYGLEADAVPAGMTLADLMAVCAAAGAVPDRAEAPVELGVDKDMEQQLQDGRYIRISQRVLSNGGVICTYTDFTAEKQAEAKLLHRTLHDVLTGLPNRRLLVDRAEQALAVARRGRNTAVMLLDIDYFKSVNDSLGHAAGDELLKAVAGRLAACVRGSDTVARLGGDEFAVLLSEGDHTWDPATAARRILEAMKAPVMLEGRPIRVGMSIGIAQPPADGTTVDDILKSADVALYKAKRNGRGKFAFFNAAEDAGVCSARRLESELSRAVEENEFRIVYQPITQGASGHVAALEALIRWDHPDLGTISPAEFIPLAERNGLIVQIGDWVLEQACRDAMHLPPGIKISVNLSRVQISDRSFVARVAKILARANIAPGRIEFEVTETAILDDETNAVRVLEELCALGVSVAIDDFGVGQSALSCLKSLPIGRIKIDRSFVNDLATDPKARSIFVAVVSLAKSLGIQTTAEGIETEQQRLIAAMAGCDQLQGYFLGRPQDLDRLELEKNALGTERDLFDIAS